MPSRMISSSFAPSRMSPAELNELWPLEEFVGYACGHDCQVFELPVINIANNRVFTCLRHALLYNCIRFRSTKAASSPLTD